MKHTLKVFSVTTLLMFAMPTAPLFAVSGSNPSESPDASESPDVSESPEASESPELSESPKASSTPKQSASPTVSRTPEVEDEDEDEAEPSKTPKASVTPRASGTPKISKTPEVEDEQEDENEDEANETPEVKVPKDLEDDVAKLASGDEDLTRVEVDEDEGRVEVKYRLRAKLFGLVDVPYELEAKVDAKEGTIKAQGPWWLLFARDNVDDVQSALDADETLTDATNQGSVLSKIIAILKSIAQ
jgi:hypothetical protein